MQKQTRTMLSHVSLLTNSSKLCCTVPAWSGQPVKAQSLPSAAAIAATCSASMQNQQRQGIRCPGSPCWKGGRRRGCSVTMCCHKLCQFEFVAVLHIKCDMVTPVLRSASGRCLAHHGMLMQQIAWRLCHGSANCMQLVRKS